VITDDLRQRRLEIIREHMDTEVTQEFDRTLATFNGHPRYEIMPTGQIFDGDEEVMGYYRMTRTAFPDQRHDNVRYHVTDDTVIVEFDLLGTNLGGSTAFRRRPRRFACRSSRCSSSTATASSTSVSTSTRRAW
jgi:SnoaL-like domain